MPLARCIARAFLEIERGQRSAWTLERYVTPLLLRILARTPPFPYGRPLRPSDVGGVAVSTGASRVYLTVGISAPDEKWDALLIELRRLDRRWLVVDLARLSWRCPAGGPVHARDTSLAVAS